MATAVNALEIPVSTIQSATAASYTVPANRYAIVRAGVHRGGQLQINGTVVLHSEDTSWNTQAVNQAIGTGNTANGVMLGVTQIAFASTGPGAPFANATARMFSSPHETTFKVPPGTTIVGTGTARYHIELYKMPGSAT